MARARGPSSSFAITLQIASPTHTSRSALPPIGLDCISPGTLARSACVARLLSGRLDAPLFWPDIYRLVIDCNRPLDAASLIVVESEGRAAPRNVGVSGTERARRIERIHAPYHDAVDACLARRLAAGLPTVLI